ncbi:hypothetical protein HD806DRAFT_233268 [Xylariaceae sp. AK1471]|nr:hypothetical protein HD806DRAFT_233268 [Xylariaceae sp. AK1471]
MAEIADSDSPDPLASSSPQWPRSPAVDDFDTDLEDLPSPVDPASPSIEDTDEDDDDDDDDDDEDTSIDEDEDEDEDDEDFDDLDFDFDMRDVELDFDDGFYDRDDEEGGLFVENYIDFPHGAEGHFNAIQHAFLHEIEQHLQDHWAMRSPSPDMYHHHHVGVGARDGAAARSRQQRDQLVQVEMAGQGQGQANAAAGGQRDPRRPPPGVDVIDLTGDDDAEMPPLRPHPFIEPGQPARSVAQRQSGNLRRQRSQQQNAPPRLNRSDGNYMDDQQVIVLSSSDDEDQPLRASPRRNANNHINQNPQPNRHNQNNNNAGRGARNARLGDQLRQQLGQPPAPQNPNPNPLPSLPLGSRFAQLVRHMPLFHMLGNPAPPPMAARNNRPDDDIVITGEQRVGEQPGGAGAGARQGFIGLGNIQLDYALHPFPPMQVPPHIAAAAAAAAAGPPKPAHEPPKPARPGFTRDTGEDVVAICPSCDQELAYDPEGDDDAPATPAKKPRSRKAQAEHHFWAVKACGHVYCRKCFDNRRSTAKNAPSVSFRPDNDGTKKLFCAVEDCDSEVSPKSAWVGIFM